MPVPQRPSPHRPSSSEDIGLEFVEADIHSGFALLDLAEDECLFGTPEGARSALDGAECACSDCQWRILGLREAEFQRWNPRLNALRSAIAAMRLRFASS